MNARHMIYGLAIALATSIILNVAAVVAAVSIATAKAKETDDASNRRWCTLLVGIDTIYQKTPPLTLSGKQFAAGIHGLTISFGCRGDQND